MQERLDKLAGERDELQSRITEGQQQIVVAKAVADRDRDVDALFRRAAEIFSKATEPEQR